MTFAFRNLFSLQQFSLVKNTENPILFHYVCISTSGAQELFLPTSYLSRVVVIS